jgi:uncharacterized membrane protein
MLRKALFAAFLCLPLVLFAKSYHYTKITTEIRCEPEGNVHVRQERTYEFDGSFSWAFVNLKKQGAKNIFFNFVAEKTPTGQTPLRDVQVTDNPSSVYVRWGYRAENETRTFILDYTIEGAVKRYQDVAEFYWKIIEDQHEKIDRLKMEIDLPGSSARLFKVYIHSRAAPGILEFSERKDRAIVLQDNIPKDAFVEVRLLAMPEIFPLARFNPQRRYQEILAAEKRNFLVSTVRTFVVLPVGLAFMFLLPLLLVLFFYFRHGREPKIDYDAEYEHEPPRPAPPLVVAAILEQKPEEQKRNRLLSRGMFATLLDLATKGCVSVAETDPGHSKQYRFKLEKPAEVEKLDFFSRQVANFFFGKVSAGKNSFTEKELKAYLRSNPTSIRSLFTSLFDYALDWWEKTLKTPLLAPDSTRAYRLYFWITIPVMLVGYLCFAIGLGSFAGKFTVGLVVSMPVLLISFLIYSLSAKPILRWSEPCYLEHKRWRAFRKFLLDFSAIKQAPVKLLAIWEQYYVYATVLGVAGEFLKHVTQLAREREATLGLPIWYFGAAGAATTDLASMSAGLSSFQSFADNFSSTMQSFSTSTSSGGGFSGGGGGGGGGGSSGAG